jgi:tetratricopeptide (TPR) repeat protein
VNNSFKFVLLVLLVKPLNGLGQQEPASAFEPSGFEPSRLESLVAAAQKAQAVSDYAAAASDYKQAVKLRPDMPELWANLGLMQHESKDVSGAIASFQQANRLNPSLYVPNLFLGIDYVRTGRQKEAIPLLVKAERTNKTDPQAPLALGRAYIFEGKFSAAADELVRATTLDPKLGAAWFTLGIAHLDQVEVDARSLSTRGKESPFAGALFAESLQKQARFGEAANLYKSLLDSRPQPPCLRSELGFSLLREHDPAGAAAEFASERTAHPECGLALLGQARMAIDNGNSEQAFKLLNDLWNRDHGFVASSAAMLLEGLSSENASSFVSLLSSQAGVLIAADLANALSTAFNFSAQDPAEAPIPAARRTADEYYAAGQFQPCARRLESSFSTLRADQLRVLAACAFFTGDNQLAARAANALEAVQPHSLEALYWSIQAHERLALQSLAHFQQLEPDSARSHVLLGDIYHQLERHDDAQAEYLKALAIAPNDPAAMLGLAAAYLSNNNDQGAMGTAQAALARNPEDPELNLILGEATLAKYDYAP